VKHNLKASLRRHGMQQVQHNEQTKIMDKRQSGGASVTAVFL
jgi:hypothetical protein